MFEKVRKALVLLFVTTGILSLGACATMEGMGKDVENAGEEIQDAAND